MIVNIKKIQKWKQVLIVILFFLALVSTIKGVYNGMNSSMDLIWDWFREALLEKHFDGAYFPSTIWLLFPLGLLPYDVAKVVWIFLNIVFTGIIIFSLKNTFLRNLKGEDFLALSLFMISGGPWRTNLSNGQYTLCVVAMFLLSVYLMETRHDIASGIALAMCLFKYQITGFLPIFYLYKKKYKALAAAVLIHVASFVMCAFWFGGIKEVSLKQMQFAYRHNQSGNVDIGSIFGIGQYTAVLFVAAGLVLVVIAYKLGKGLDTLLVSICFFSAWATVYQRIYCFFPLIIPLGYELYKGIYEQERYNKILFYVLLGFTVIYFYGFTVSETIALIIVRIGFYAVFAMLCIDLGRENSKNKAGKQEARISEK